MTAILSIIRRDLESRNIWLAEGLFWSPAPDKMAFISPHLAVEPVPDERLGSVVVGLLSCFATEFGATHTHTVEGGSRDCGRCGDAEGVRLGVRAGRVEAGPGAGPRLTSPPYGATSRTRGPGLAAAYWGVYRGARVQPWPHEWEV